MRREYMIQFREERGIEIQIMAKKCKISKTLLEMLEESDQEVTHPKIAECVGRAYKLNKQQIESLMPEHHRKSSPNYNPDLYRREELDFNEFAVMSGWGKSRYL